MSRRDFVSKERNRRDYGNSSQPEKAGLGSSADSSVWRKLLSAGRLREVRGAAAVPLRAAPIIGGRPPAQRGVFRTLPIGGPRGAVGPTPFHKRARVYGPFIWIIYR